MRRIAVLVAAGVIAVGGSGATPGAAHYPTTFVGVSGAAGAPGLTVYSSATGKALRRLTRDDRDGQPMLSADRRSVYFVGPGAPGGCAWEQVDVVHLRTGRRHRIEGEVTGLAWSPSGALAVVTPVAPTAAGRIRLISDPVVISPRAGNYCWFGFCYGWTYAIVSVAGSHTHVLTSVVRRDAVATTATVDDAGGAVIFTLPMANGYPRVWRWSGGRPVPLPAPGAFSAQPAW